MWSHFTHFLHSGRENLFYSSSWVNLLLIIPFSCPPVSLASSIFFSQLASSSQPKKWTPILIWYHPMLPLFPQTSLVSLAFDSCLCHYSVSLPKDTIPVSQCSISWSLHSILKTQPPALLPKSSLKPSLSHSITTVIVHVSMSFKLLQHLMNLGYIHIT